MSARARAPKTRAMFASTSEDARDMKTRVAAWGGVDVDVSKTISTPIIAAFVDACASSRATAGSDDARAGGPSSSDGRTRARGRARARGEVETDE